MQYTRYYLIAPNPQLASLIADRSSDWEALLSRTLWSNSEGGRTAVTDEEWRDKVQELFVVYMRKFLLPAPIATALGLHGEQRPVDIFSRWWTIEGMEEDESTFDVANALRKRSDLTTEERGILNSFPDRRQD